MTGQTTLTRRPANQPPNYDLLFDCLRADERFPNRYAASDFARFRVVGVHLPTKQEPPTTTERRDALEWYAAQIEDARANLTEAERDYRFGRARRCKLRLLALIWERGVWVDSWRYVLSDSVRNGARPFNQFATSRGAKV